MKYRLAPIHCRPWLLNGLSLKLIESHYENNYGGALRRLNAISDKLATLDLATTPPHVLNGLKRDELTALNSTLLHELYFASMGGLDGKPSQAFRDILARDFGSYYRWRDELVAMAMGLAGGSGWVLLAYMPRDGRLINQYASEHGQAIAGGVPILALDMYEHAYHIDFGANAKAYIETFLRNVDWKAVEARYEDAIQVRPPRPLEQKEFEGIPGVDVEEVKALVDTGQAVQFIDARPRFSMSRMQDIIEGATWKDPDRVEEWAPSLSKTDPVIVYCVYGFHVGCKTAGALRDLGFDARFMKGGHVSWRALGGPVKMNV